MLIHFDDILQKSRIIPTIFVFNTIFLLNTHQTSRISTLICTLTFLIVLKPLFDLAESLSYHDCVISTQVTINFCLKTPRVHLNCRHTTYFWVRMKAKSFVVVSFGFMLQNFVVCLHVHQLRKTRKTEKKLKILE